MDSIFLVPHGVVGQRGRRDGQGASRGDGADAAGGGDLGAGPHNLGDRREERLWGHGRLQLGWE